MTEEPDFFSSKPQRSFSIIEFGQKALANWPIFIISLAICIGGAALYLRFAIPKYAATTLIMVKGKTAASKEDLVESAVSASLRPNFDLDNELELLRSESLIARVVLKNSFNVSYYLVGNIKKSEVYLSAPFRLVPQTINDSSSAVSMTLQALNNTGGVIEYGAKGETKKFAFKWNQPFRTAGKMFVLAKREDFSKSNQKYLVTWSPVEATAAEIASKFTVGLLNKNTSIIQLSLVAQNAKRAQDILDAIAREYDLSDIEERTVITRNTLRFIDDRLTLISNELSGVESNLESYQGRNEIINLGTQSAQSFGNANDVSQNMKEINIKQGVVQMIRNYFNNPASEDKLVPSTMGLDDATLSSLIGKYNDLQLTKQREAPLVAANSTVMEDLNNQINNVRGSILESLQNISRSLTLQENNYQQQNGQYQQFLSSLPRKERVMQEIKRKQSITEGLYLYLLQKREEAAISSTSASVSNYKQIEPAKSMGLVEPNGANIQLYSVILGLLIPFGVIYMKDFFNDKVISRYDLSEKVDLPVIGDVNHIGQNKESEELVVMSREVVGEQFRIIRTNLALLLKKKEKQVILVTSSVSGEGKTFISYNLAGVLAIPGKRVALLKFDLRKSEITNNSTQDKGLTDFLSQSTNDLSGLYQVSNDIPSLHIYSSGTVTANPGDLMLSASLSHLLSKLRQTYDYIIIDSAPVGLVSDAFILGEYSDIVLYVIRQRITEKKQLEYLNDIVLNEKFTDIALVLNDVKTGGKLGYYGFGYGGQYGKYIEAKKK